MVAGDGTRALLARLGRRRRCALRGPRAGGVLGPAGQFRYIPARSQGGARGPAAAQAAPRRPIHIDDDTCVNDALAPILAASNLSRHYGARHAVRDVSLTVARGEVLGLLGPNGAGKTTTLQMITGNLAPDAGEVRIRGIDLLDNPVGAKRHVGYLPETPPLYRDQTVREYLRLAARLRRVSKAKVAAAVDRAMERTGVGDVAGRLIGTLSKGYQQRVGIAQAIVHEPDLVVLDEPTVGLDPNQIRDIRALVRELAGSHSVILSTHILPEVETVCDRVQILHDGRVVYADTIAALRNQRGGQALTVTLLRPPDGETLRAVPGVRSAELLAPGRFRLVHEPGASPAEALARRCVVDDWGLVALVPEETTLEEVFVQLTQRDEAEAPVAETQP
ncbi:MAG: ABC transporter ATP-binding protein [Rhodocyclaceae bacterium]|nr:ABC transporter ATP-binding protein [Rhodocyclaceae bacterium]MCA3134201.1 ABC transporter ATP-binding protein [Rhodocyclaceae bacterium]MCA3145988.1 ABC transporter ATP-binding protein [Rhodocyclaceae bacterium]